MGDLYCTGTIDGFIDKRNVSNQLQRLLYPTPYPQGEQRVPTTTVAQFSSGRTHILALSDTGRIWVWTNIPLPALHVKFLHVDYVEDQIPAVPKGQAADMGKVKWVVAGWDCSSAYIAKKGIVVWKTISPLSQNARVTGEITNLTDGFLAYSETVPDTWYQRPKGSSRDASAEVEAVGRRVGQVVGHVALEGYIVFLTDIGKVLTAKHADLRQIAERAVELEGFEPGEGKGKMCGIQGSFRSFAVFNTDGDVVLGDRDLLDRAWSKATELQTTEMDDSQPGDESIVPKHPEALQNRGIISLAFGDWHTLALTAQGHILSFGKAPQSCGCLGLGRWDEGSVLRGVGTSTTWTLDSELVGPFRDQGRRIWFSPESREWLKYMMHSGIYRDALSLISGARPDRARHVQISEWFEKEGTDWDMHDDLDDDSQPWGQGQPSYLALSISAAGWHSGALVLTNQHRIKKTYTAHKSFLPLSDGEPAPEQEGMLSDTWQWLSSWWQGAPPEAEPEVSAAEDHSIGKAHSFYHSKKPIGETWRALPAAARHAVRFSDHP